MRQLQRQAAIVLGTLGFILSSAAASAQASDTDKQIEQADEPKPRGGLLLDIKDYYTAPLRWDVKDWAYFGGSLAAIAAAHHYDTQVRTHFTKDLKPPLSTDTKDLQDALPAAAALAGTWLFANLIDDNNGRKEAWAMAEAAGLSTVTSYGLKYAAGRLRPDQTSDPNDWRKSGSSFPSVHVTAAFAIGTVMAESGSDEYRWARRFLGYGMAGFTGYERLKHNAHWLSDTVAGAALGASTAHFVMHRTYHSNGDSMNSSLMVVPIEGGAMLSYNLTLP